MIDTDKYEGHTPTEEWDDIVYADNYLSIFLNDATIMATDLDRRLMADAPLLLAEVKRLHDGIRSILSDYDITELIRDVPQDEWNFEQQALIRMKEMIE